MKRKDAAAVRFGEKKRVITGDAAVIVRAALIAAAGFIAAPGRFLFGSYPFGAAVVAAVSGAYSAPAALLGAAFGSLRISGGAIHIPFLAALVLGRCVICVILDSDGGKGVRENGKKRLPARAGALLARGAAVRYNESVYVRMTLSSVASLAGGVMLAASGAGGVSFLSAFASSLLSPLLVRLFCASPFWRILCPDESRRERDPMLREAGTVALCASLVLSLYTVRIPVVDPGVVCVFVIALFTVRRRGVPLGVLRGFVCGAVISPDVASAAVVYAAAYGVLSRFSDIFAVFAATAAATAWGYRMAGLDVLTAILPELIVSAALFMPATVLGLVPVRSGGRVRGEKRAEAGVSLSPEANDRTARKLENLSEGLSSVSKELYRLSNEAASPAEEEIRAVCESSFRSVCGGCGMRTACFEKEPDDLKRVMTEMASQLGADGRVSASALSRTVAKRCYNAGEIIDRINERYAEAVARAKLFDRTAVVASDYEAVSEMLKDAAAKDGEESERDGKLSLELSEILPSKGFFADSVAVVGKRRKRIVASGVDLGGTSLGSEEIRALFGGICGIEFSPPLFSIEGDSVNMRLDPAPMISAEFGGASEAAAGERAWQETDGRRTKGAVCGDVLKTFETAEGRLFMLISDGMGSGKEAAKTARVCAAFLEKMLVSGVAMGTAMKMLNSLIRARGTECSATVDIMEIDLMTGKAKFVKSGAAPSFVVRGGRLFRLQSKTVPIGIIRALDAEMISFDVEPDDVIVMVSDGVARSFEEATWLCDLLTDRSDLHGSPEKMAKTIVALAAESGSTDDITAGIVVVSKAV